MEGAGEAERMSVEVVRAKLLGDVPHGFLGRAGGVSTGIYAGLNCSLGSDAEGLWLPSCQVPRWHAYIKSIRQTS
jgi:hypothetical protein